ncbi:MAG: HAMP domain-containing protein [Deltaproteobacteria bacterium]|nr:HAMP domain-containing protein [Deltaproteobacteria bacterium]
MLRMNSLTFRLSGLLIITLGILFGITAVIQIGAQQRYAEHCARINGLALTEVIYGALNTSMLAEDGHTQLQQSVLHIAQESPNLKIRIFNKQGATAISSMPSEIGKKLNKQEDELCRRCHATDKPLPHLKTIDRVRTFEVDGHPALGITMPISNQASCSTAACHAHSSKETLLGLLDVTLLLTPAEKARRDTMQLSITSSVLAFFLIVGVALLIVRHAVRGPIRRLSRSVTALGEGNYAARIEEDDIEEFNVLGRALNGMARDLERANASLLEWNQTLERRVDEKTAALEQAQEQMIRVERMASLGKLAAVVAHEINNPLASVVTYSKLMIRRISKQPELKEQYSDSMEILDAISSEATRCGEIVTNLLLFARRTGSKQEPTDVNDAINKAFFLIKHKMDLSEVTDNRSLAERLPKIFCDPGQLEQALLALFVNAIEAMMGGGVLSVTSKPDGDKIKIVVSDTGMGMSEDVRKHIFEPFFTTKSDEEGSKGLGLGLSVVYGIVQRNSGAIDVFSDEGIGTRFVLRFTAISESDPADTPPEGN